MPTIKKVVLVGTKDSPYVSSRGMKRPRVIVQAEGDVRLLVTVRGDLAGDFTQHEITQGDHEVTPGNWIMVSVVEGDHTSVLCTLVSAA